MTDPTTKKPICVEIDAKDRPYIETPTSRVDQIRTLLDANGVRFWVDHTAISIDGQPYTTLVYINRGTTAERVQTLLDTVA